MFTELDSREARNLKWDLETSDFNEDYTKTELVDGFQYYFVVIVAANRTPLGTILYQSLDLSEQYLRMYESSSKRACCIVEACCLML